MKKYLFIFTLLLLGESAFAQIDKEKGMKPQAELKIADLLYAQGLYYSATEYYKEVIREKPNNRYARYWLAMSYAKSNDYENAELWFDKFVNYKLEEKDKVKKIEKENKTEFSKARFYYGQALKNNGKYEEAISQFKGFKANYVPSNKKKQTKDEQNWLGKSDVEIKGAEMALEMANYTRKVKINPLGSKVNSGYEETSPMPVGDSLLYYSSFNRSDLIRINKVKDIPAYRIYQSNKVDGEWQEGKMLPTYINDAKYSTGNAAISEDGNRMYFCKCYNNEIDEIICAINFSQKNDNKWSEPVQLNSSINDPRYTSTQPSVRTSGDDMDIVYFVSDREGGVGGMDIWYFIRTANGDFKGPRLLKGPINTEFDELTPYYSNYDSTFYFSSNGHPSIGGFDVFKSTENDELQWIEPVNVGKPINSPADDLYYINEAGKTSGFLVSNRNGTTLIKDRYRGDDIFYFEDFRYGLGGMIVKEGTEETGKTLIEEAKVKLYAIDLEGKKVLVDEVDVKNGEYFFNLKPDMDYTVEVIKPGFSSIFEEITTKNLADEDTLMRELSVTKTRVAAYGSLYNADDSLKTTKLDNALVTLVERLANGTLKNVAAVKISETHPFYNFELDVLKKYEVKIAKDGYFAKTVPLDLAGLKQDQDTLFTNISIAKIEVGKPYAIDNVLYEFGKAELTASSKKLMEDVAKLMQENPVIIVEISAHTDAIGSDAANLKLSQERAQNCVDYLIKTLKISPERLVAKGYGETTPIAPNEKEDGSDNPDGRSKNRRTEFMVLGGL